MTLKKLSPGSCLSSNKWGTSGTFVPSLNIETDVIILNKSDDKTSEKFLKSVFDGTLDKVLK